MNAQYLMAYGLETFYSYFKANHTMWWIFWIMTSSLNKIWSVFYWI